MSFSNRKQIVQHRLDIDGLRAFAIIPVLLFHSGFQVFSGGYVGVDVFFTISGFLITSILIRDIDTKQFSYIEFFKRRIRRLMPMAILIYLVVLSLFVFLYPVSYFKDVAAATFSSLLFFSNIYFWKEGGGYFGVDLELNPLLHTWSLSVEEQFYLVFPFLLIVLFWLTKNATQKMALILLGILISLSVAVLYAPSRESFAAFYLLPPRMYELAIGSLTAVFVYYWPHHEIRKIKYLQELGLFLVVLPVFTFSKSTLFPSYNALLPCLGAALVMLSTGSSSLSGRLLNSRFAVYIGLISYSLYLWHWPLIVVKNWTVNDAQNTFLDIIIIAISVLLSAFTYKYIERPFRNKALVPDKKLIVFAGISFLSVGVLSITLYYEDNGFIVDSDGRINSTYQEAIAPPPNRGPCFEKVRTTGQFFSCNLSTNNTKKNKKIFVWGDSHGSAFMPVLAKLSEKYDIKFSNNSGCPPVINLKRTDFSQSCPRISQQIFENIISDDYDLVILVGAFSNYLNFGVVGQLDAEQGEDPQLSLRDFSKLMPATLEKFEQEDMPFLIVVQPPRMERRIPDEFVRVETLGEKYLGDTIPLEEYEKQIASLFDAIPQKWHQNLISLKHVYCPDKTCVSVRNGTLLYKDSHHISNAYAEYLSGYFTPIVETKLNSRLAGR
jgi:peptidoglycan/LPS O-acetylase OafA/YrhL